nr:hypothetical protein [Tanacetum cinerariifolium]
MNSSTKCFFDMCLSGLRGLHYLLDKVVQVGPLQGPITAIMTTVTITNGDEMQKVRMFRKQYPLNKVQQMEGARGRAYVIGGGICDGGCHDGMAVAAMVVWQRGIEEVARWWLLVGAVVGGDDGYEGDGVERFGCGVTTAVMAGICRNKGEAT